MRVAVTGREGQLARSLADRAAHFPGLDVVALGRPGLDLERPASIAATVAEAQPDIVVNAAAYTAVDKAEQESAKAFAVNRDGAAAVAEAAVRLKVPLIHVSTDYVYGGDKSGPYVETDPTSPLGIYGRSKLAGEEAVLAIHPGAVILRTSWVYSPFGNNFVKTMLRLSDEREELRVVDDQTGNPTSALDLADAILRIAPRLVRDKPGQQLFHLAGEGSVTWHGFAAYIFERAAERGNRVPRLIAIPTSAYPTPARRPANSQLDCGAFRQSHGFSLPSWQHGVDETLSRLL